MFRLYVDQASIKLKAIEPLTSGRTGLKVQISFNQDWLNLTKIVSYEYRTPGEPTIEIQDEEFDGVVSTVPAGVLENSGGELYISIRGTNEGITVIPTIYALMGTVRESFIPEYVPTPTAHTHSNKAIIDKFETSDFYVKPVNGIPLSDIDGDVYSKPSTGIPKADLSQDLQSFVDSIMSSEITLNTPGIANTNPVRVKNVYGGWLKIGKIVFVHVNFRANIQFTPYDWWSVLTGFPKPYLFNPALAGVNYLDDSPYTTKPVSGYVNSGGSLCVVTGPSTINVDDIIRITGVYLTGD